MKKFGSKSEYKKERAADLLVAYFRYLDSCSYIRMNELFASVVNMPASRFWVSASRAAVVISAIRRGVSLKNMRPNKREMFFEIHRRVMKLRKKHPDLSYGILTELVVAQPAPKFYISASSARAIILKERKLWFPLNFKKLKPVKK